MISALGKVGTYITKCVNKAKPVVTRVVSALPQDVVTLSTKAKKAVKSPKTLLSTITKFAKNIAKNTGKVWKSAKNWTVAHIKMLYQGAVKIAKNIGNYLSKFTKAFVKNADKVV